MNHSSRLSRSAALLAAATLVAAGASTAVASTASASTTPAGAARSAAQRGAHSLIPFTSATVAAGATSGTLSVTWSAPHLPAAWPCSPARARAPSLTSSASARATATLTVTAAYGDWIRLVPDGRRAPRADRPRSGPGQRPQPARHRRLPHDRRPVGADGRGLPLPGALAQPGRPRHGQQLGITADYDLRTTEEIAAVSRRRSGRRHLHEPQRHGRHLARPDADKRRRGRVVHGRDRAGLRHQPDRPGGVRRAADRHRRQQWRRALPLHRGQGPHRLGHRRPAHPARRAAGHRRRRTTC